MEEKSYSVRIEADFIRASSPEEAAKLVVESLTEGNLPVDVKSSTALPEDPHDSIILNLRGQLRYEVKPDEHGVNYEDMFPEPQWKLHSFNSRSVHYSSLSEEEASQLIDEGALPLSNHSHGRSLFYLSGEAPDCRWDTAYFAGLLEPVGNDLPSSKKELEASARSFLDCYNMWANGDVFSYYIKAENGDEIDSCHGILGRDGVKQCLIDNGWGHLVEDEHFIKNGWEF